MSEQPLQSAVALVTGATGGVGAATAHRLAQEGAAIALAGDRREHLEPTVRDVIGGGGRAAALAADLTTADGASDAVQETLRRFGRLDILIIAAGHQLINTALHATVEEWDRMVAVNLTTALHITHAAVPYLIDAAATAPRQVADLVIVGSTAGRVARPASSAYSLTQFGLAGFTESLRQELRPEGVRVGQVRPGDVSAGAAHETGALRPVDVADAISYLVTRQRQVSVNEMVLRSSGQTW
ncbi:SDR family NAD(P)-dependent oxidoreductase [Hamadaea sp. NPDC051192]|uniref:SDR family oxidoreductase n=1 Tax=Hamadaea sp. NPDC051192 TaxID=3154940 RepID=UPI0034392B5E